MTYFIDLFSPETYAAFTQSARDITGFNQRHRRTAETVQVGDKFVCYVTRLSRWCGLLEVVEGPFFDDTPLFVPENDPWVIRFRVRALVWLALLKSIPIHENSIWAGLSFTKDLPDKRILSWTGRFRGSLGRLDSADGIFLAQKLELQDIQGTEYPISEEDNRKLAIYRVNRSDRTVTASVPESTPEKIIDSPAEPAIRESIRVQALIASIGSRMGMSIWIPRPDRERVLREWNDSENLLDRLPLNYDEVTLRTIENIDILWLQGRSIVRAFEVEHTTSIYSGILRMADLLALQPNMDINLHIVAPDERRDKVLQEISRPVFSLLERGPLKESCTYLSCASLQKLAREKHLQHLKHDVLDEYVEAAEPEDD